MRIGSFASEAWKARAAPRKPVWIDGGRLISRAAPLMASTASPREAPGARLNEIVTAGDCPLGGVAGGGARPRPLAPAGSGPLPPAPPGGGRAPPAPRVGPTDIPPRPPRGA